MGRHILDRTFASATGIAALLAWPAASYAATAEADGIAAHIVAKNIETIFGPVAPVEGVGPGAFNNDAVVRQESSSTPLLPLNPTPTIYVNAQNVRSEVKSPGVGVDTISAESHSEVGSVSLSINLNPLPPTVEPQPFLNVMATGVHARANFFQVVPGPAKATGTSNFDSLTITGSLVGGATLTFSGDAKPNTVIYSTPTVTITLNREVRTGTTTCNPGCTFTPSSIQTVAVLVGLYKAVWRGQEYTGNIEIGRAYVQ